MRHIAVRQASSIFRYRFHEYRTRLIPGESVYLASTETQSGSVRERHRRVDIFDRLAHCTSHPELASHYCTYSVSTVVLHQPRLPRVMGHRRRGTYQKHGE